MKKRDSWFLIACVLVLLILIFFAPSYGWRLREFLTPGASSSDAPTQASTPDLTAENEALEAQLAQLQGIEAQLPQSSSDDIRAMVYSRYPLNFKSELLVNAGSNEGVVQGDAVLFQGILVGSVEKVFADSSLVETIFDSNFKTPVRVGSGGYDALLQGGAYPEATSIDKHAPVAVGDIVYSAAAGLPYDLPIATIASTSTTPDNLFQAATLSFAYDINDIETVLIAK